MACQPVIGEVLSQLSELPGCLLTRMSGSGATCFALFDTSSQAAAASDLIAASRPGWWVQAVTLS
jgi:4-diphosphocytidyl-2-C-methyl-D-erythritol kinase